MIVDVRRRPRVHRKEQQVNLCRAGLETCCRVSNEVRYRRDCWDTAIRIQALVMVAQVSDKKA